jgi:O-succinylbenzoate synthase
MPLAEIRKSFGDIKLMVDANCAYTLADIPHLSSLDDFGLLMIEQPLPKDDLEGHAKLQSVLRTPVCLDESAGDLATVDKAIAMKSCKIVNIKIQRVGGLLHAVEIHDACSRAGIPVWGGTMPELGIGGVQTLHLATLENFTFPTDVESSRRWFIDDIIDPLIEVRDGRIDIAEGTGNCFRLNRDKLKKYIVREETFSETPRVV